MNLAIISNHSVGLLNFRSEVISAFIEKGHKVTVIYPVDNNDKKIRELGCETIDLKMSRRGINPFEDILVVWKLKNILKEGDFECVLTYTIKPNIYGNLLTKYMKIPTIANITGLGTSFEKEGLLKKLVSFLYKAAFKRTHTVFFQNEHNYELMRDLSIVRNNCIILPGSGVNLKRFHELPFEPKKTSAYLYAGRIMKDKGTKELLEAFSSDKITADCSLSIYGFVEEDFKEEFELYLSKPHQRIKFYDFTSNLQDVFIKHEVVINPSYHEGMSNLLLEAAASNRVLMASNIPGCKEIIEDGVNGLLFAPASSSDIISAVNDYSQLTNDDKCSMSKKSREIVERKFNRDQVIAEYLKVLEEIQNENKYK